MNTVTRNRFALRYIHLDDVKSGPTKTKVVVYTHLNLVYFLQSSRTGGHLEIFHTLEELCTYTIENRKYFLKA